MILSRVTSKSQTTVPRPVREALGLKPGDSLAYAIGDDGAVRIRKAPAVSDDPFDNPFATFTEWADEIDCEAFKDL